MLGNLPVSKIDSYSSCGYHDGPISGWLRTRGTYFYFDAISIYDDERLYVVYLVTKNKKIKQLERVRKFRHMVGRHMLWIKGKKSCYFSSDEKPEWQSYYDLPALERVTEDDKRPLGISDLKTVRWFTKETIKEIKRNDVDV